jgi:hypothetical protein
MKNISKVVSIALILLIVIYALSLPIVIISLWNEPIAQSIFPFLDISSEFPTKIVAGFTAVLAWATILLAYFTYKTIENTKIQNTNDRNSMILTEIIQWSTDILKLQSELLNFSESLRIDIDFVFPPFRDLYNEGAALSNKGKYYKRVAVIAGDSTRELIEKLCAELSVVIGLLDKAKIQDEIDGDFKQHITSLDIHLRDLYPAKDTVEKHLEKLTSLSNQIISNCADKKISSI